MKHDAIKWDRGWCFSSAPQVCLYIHVKSKLKPQNMHVFNSTIGKSGIWLHVRVFFWYKIIRRILRFGLHGAKNTSNPRWG